MSDALDAGRFVEAQNPVYEQVCHELRAGCKRSHWMWFIFPQLQGLGHSSMAARFSIASLEAAEAYLRHPILGARLTECTRLVNALEGRSVDQIFGYPDNLKFHSCMTLFARAAGEDNVFKQALEQHFGGKLDEATMRGL